MGQCVASAQGAYAGCSGPDGGDVAGSVEFAVEDESVPALPLKTPEPKTCSLNAMLPVLGVDVVTLKDGLALISAF